MDRYGFVTTPTALARELIAACQRSRPRDVKVLAIYGLPGFELPPGSRTMRVPTYSGFRRFIRRNDISQIVFVARLNMAPIFWIQALFHWRFLSLFLRRDILSPGVLPQLLRQVPSEALRFIKEGLEKMKVEVAHPHSVIPDEFQLLARDCSCKMSETETNQVRILLADVYSRGSQSFLTLSEGCLVGMSLPDVPELIAVERSGTQELIAQLTPAHRSRFARIVLVKNGLDATMIAYPVIGTDTIKAAAAHGVTDILISVDCVIQGKPEVIRLARESRIGIRTLEIG
jgi:DUF1009 family protein